MPTKRRNRAGRHAADVRRRRRRHLLHHAAQRKLPHAHDARRCRGRHRPRHLQGRPRSMPDRRPPRSNLFGSGAILREALRAQRILAEKYEISSQAWSVTSYTQLRREAQEADAGTCCTPTNRRGSCTLDRVLAGERRSVHRQLRLRPGGARADRPWVPGGLYAWAPTGLGAATRGRICGGTSRSMPSASRWPRSSSLPTAVSSTKAAGQGDRRFGHRSRKDRSLMIA